MAVLAYQGRASWGVLWVAQEATGGNELLAKAAGGLLYRVEKPGCVGYGDQYRRF